MLALAALVAGCGSANVVSPVDIAQNYVSAVGEGNYPGACALFEPRALAALLASTPAHPTCTALLARCLPSRVTVTSADKLQLLYVNVDLRMYGSRAVALVSGLPVAAAIKQVTMVRLKTHWRLTSPGQAIDRCVRRLQHQRHHHHQRSSPGG